MILNREYLFKNVVTASLPPVMPYLRDKRISQEEISNKSSGETMNHMRDTVPLDLPFRGSAE